MTANLLQVTCPGCARRLRVPRGYVGLRVCCRFCDVELQIVERGAIFPASEDTQERMGVASVAPSRKLRLMPESAGANDRVEVAANRLDAAIEERETLRRQLEELQRRAEDAERLAERSKEAMASPTFVPRPKMMSLGVKNEPAVAHAGPMQALWSHHESIVDRVKRESRVRVDFPPPLQPRNAPLEPSGPDLNSGTLERELDRLRALLDAERNRVREMEDRQTESEGRRRALETALHDQQTRSDATQAELITRLRELEATARDQSVAEALERRLHALEAELAEAVSALDDARRARCDGLDGRDAVLADLAASNRQIQALRRELLELRELLEHARAIQKLTESEREGLRARCEAAETKLRQAEALSAAAHDRAEALGREAAALRVELRATRANAESAVLALEAKTQALRDVQAALEAAHKQPVVSEEDERRRRIERDRLEETQRRLTRELAESRAWNDRARIQVAELHAQRAGLFGHLQQLAKALDTERSRVGALAEERECASHALKQTQAKFDALQTRHAEAVEQIGRLEAAQQSVIEDRERQAGELARLQAERDEAVTDLAQADEDIELLEAAAEQADRLREECQALQMALEVARKERNEAREALADLEHVDEELEAIEAELDTLRKERDEAHVSREAATTEADQWRSAAREMEEETIRLRDELTRSETQTGELERRLELERADWNAREDELADRLEREQAGWEENRRSLWAEFEQLSAAHKEAQGRLSEAEQRLHQVRQERADLLDRLRTAQSERDRLGARIQGEQYAQDRRLAEARNDLLASQDKLHQAMGQMADLRQDRDRLAGELDAASLRLEEIERQIAERRGRSGFWVDLLRPLLGNR